MSQNGLTPRRVRYEDAVVACSRILLERGTDAVDLALAELVEASGVGRVYIFRNHRDVHGRLCMSQTHESCASGVEPQIDNPDLLGIPYSPEFDRWRRAFDAGEHIAGPIDGFPKEERAILVPQGIRSLLVFPIYVVETWVGFIGFDDVTEPRQWDIPEINLLRTASELIGSHLTRAEYERRLEDKAAALEKADGLKNRLLSILGHELRAPFISLKAVLQLLSDPTERLSDSELHEVVESANARVDEQLHLLDTVLRWALLHQGRMAEAKRELVLVDVVARVVESATPIAAAKGVTVGWNVPPKVTVHADERMVELVLGNLISNAVKFTSSGGRVDVTATSAADTVRVDVADTGVGISPDALPKLFREEHIVTTRGTNGEVGTGFGLILCRDLVSANSGTITVHSREGEGSTFSFTLPAKWER